MEAIILGILLVLVIAYVIYTYNKFISLRNRVENMWHQIRVQLQRRYDLIPNLVEIVKGYAKHERKTLEEVVEARNRAIRSDTVEETAQAERLLGQGLMNLWALVENYPDLKANRNFLSLQEELARTEDKIAYMRQAYNDSVMMYNEAIQIFPNSIVASIFGFKERPYFNVEDEEALKTPRVKF